MYAFIGMFKSVEAAYTEAKKKQGTLAPRIRMPHRCQAPTIQAIGNMRESVGMPLLSPITRGLVEKLALPIQADLGFERLFTLRADSSVCGCLPTCDGKNYS
ncbi:hypothetical protein [Xanthomonas sp. CFBP 7912]|uniref:hypothetical protein n=1 Tax=Xanthomonas sp. CFBP 7912 TaxID=1891621 RepID=UPI0011AFE846|nr:hypothetical protein [Xanthomonas sp. CFBP 7912]